MDCQFGLCSRTVSLLENGRKTGIDGLALDILFWSSK